eukprot:2696259-Prorocentrum_lima.AAC.1
MAGAEPADTLFVSAESPRPFGDDSDHRFLAGIRFRQSAEIRAVRLYASDPWLRNRDEKEDKLVLVCSKPGRCRPFE